jgi:nitrate/TMAO reductase-like tetraheme cytochrome c subunit
MNMTQATHAGVGTICKTCHEAGLSFYMGAANPGLQGRPANHTAGQMVAPNDCSLCHTTANWNSTALPAGHMPNPGNQPCTVCHIGAPANYARLAANAVLHTGISAGCITCHGAPNAPAPVFYLNFTPKSAVLSPVHIPTSSTPCESCHAVSFTSFAGTTMTPAKHTVMFAVIGSTCDACHDLPSLRFYGVNNLTTRPNGHHVGQDCSGCHSPNNWGGGATKRMVAAQTAARSTVGTVISAPAATGRFGARGGEYLGGDRLPAGNHRVSHAGVTSNCRSCHNDSLATGKGTAHITSNDACENCHTTVAWLPARFDHRGVAANCASCHNGVAALGKPTKHLQTNQDCGVCHGTITWAAATFSHLGLSATCRSCHNGIAATAKQITHSPTILDCGSCHNTMNWTIVTAPTRLRTLVPNLRGVPRGSTQ